MSLENTENVNIMLDNDLTITNIENIKQILLDNFSGNKDMQITIEKPETIDFSFIQLVASLAKTLAKNNKSLSIAASEDRQVESFLSDTGFLNAIDNLKLL